MTLRGRVVATGGPAMLDAEELAAEQADSPPLDVDGVLDMT